jgi:archaellum component FlaF (FlaF/FlaG flagellin family)
LFGFFIGITLLYLISEKFPETIALLLVCFLLFINVNGIYDARYIQTERMDYLERLTEYGRKMNTEKFILNTHNIPDNIIFFHQFMPYETMLYSALQSPDSALTFYPADNMNKFDSLLSDKTLFLGVPWDPMSAKSTTINQKYYHLPLTNYVKANTSQADTSFHESIFNNKNVSINNINFEVHSNGNKFMIVPIKILNSSGQTIRSIPDALYPVFLSYHLYDNDEELIAYDNARTTLEVDIHDEYIQGLMINLPEKKGEYLIEPDFVTDGIRWWNTTVRFRLIVD